MVTPIMPAVSRVPLDIQALEARLRKLLLLRALRREIHHVQSVTVGANVITTQEVYK